MLTDDAFKCLCDAASIDHKNKDSIQEIFMHLAQFVKGAPVKIPLSVLSIMDIINHLEYLSCLDISALLMEHGIIEGYSSEIDSLHESFICHLVQGDCLLSPLPHCTGCTSVIEQLPAKLTVFPCHFGSALLMVIKLKASLYTIRHILSVLGLPFDSLTKPVPVCLILANYLHSEVKKDHVSKYVDHGLLSCDCWFDLNRINATWPVAPDLSFQQSMVNKFLSQMSSASLKSSVHASCLEKVLDTDMVIIKSNNFDFTPLSQSDCNKNIVSVAEADEETEVNENYSPQSRFFISCSHVITF